MGDIIAWIVVGILVIILLIVYAGFMLLWLGYRSDYKKGTHIQGKVIEYVGDKEHATGSVTPGVTRYSKYGEYKVSFEWEGEEHIKNAVVRSRRKKPGDMIPVCICYDKDGNWDVLEMNMLYWSSEMAIGWTLGLIFGIVLAVCAEMGLIS